MIPGLGVPVIADFDFDGRDDVAAVSGNGVVHVFRGELDGSLTETQTLSTGAATQGGVAARFGGDPWIDLAFLNAGTSTVTILVGTSGGVFAAGSTLVTSQNPVAAGTGDFDGDGYPDLVVACGVSAKVSVFPGQAGNSFGARQDIALPFAASSLSVADVDLDQHLDLIVALPGAAGFAVLRGDGNGTFQSPAVVTGGQGVRGIAVADLDGNGTPDVAMTQQYGIRIWWGSGNGVFPTSTLLVIPGMAGPDPTPSGFAIDDLDGDGLLDLSATTVTRQALVWFRGTGGGSFGPATDLVVERISGPVQSADINGDGFRDLVLSAGDLTLLMGNGDGTFGSGLVLSTTSPTRGITLADLDGDGYEDIVAGSAWAGMPISVFRGEGDGTFGERTEFPAGGSVSDCVAADMNGDGYLDLVVANFDEDSLSILGGLGNGGFAPRTAFPTDDAPYRVAVDDFDRDGHLDVAVAGLQGVTIHLGDGAGGLGPRTDYPDGRYLTAIRTTDLDEDGFPDLVLAAYPDLKLSTMHGRGDGSFDSPVPTGRAWDPVDMAAGDFDGDGRTDFATVAAQWEPIRVSMGTGNGTLVGLEPEWYLNDGSRCLKSGEVNGDTHLDLIAAGLGVRVMTGRGDGTFERESMHYGTPWGFDLLAAGDVNGDGLTDVVIPATMQLALMVLRNLGGGGGNVSVPTAGTGDLALHVAPSPARVVTVLSFSLPEAAEVTVDAFDLAGRRVARLDRGFRSAGAHAIRWDLRGTSGSRVEPGIYFVSLSAGPRRATRKVVVLE